MSARNIQHRSKHTIYAGDEPATLRRGDVGALKRAADAAVARRGLARSYRRPLRAPLPPR